MLPSSTFFAYIYNYLEVKNLILVLNLPHTSLRTNYGKSLKVLDHFKQYRISGP